MSLAARARRSPAVSEYAADHGARARRRPAHAVPESRLRKALRRNVAGAAGLLVL